MGVLKERATGHKIVLEAENLIGRSGRCRLRLDSALISSVHASIRWTSSGWEIKDLGSTNGTFVGGVRLKPGKVHLAHSGETVAFGSAAQLWELCDDSPPQPMVLAEDGEESAFGGELIAIPSADDPEVTIYRDSDGNWQLERAGSLVRPIENGDAFEAANKQWRFYRPDIVTETRSARDGDVRGVCLSFTVSSDEEHVELAAEIAGTRIDLGSRAHNYLLLTLARRRLADVRAGVPEGDCGWMYQDELAKALATQPDHINVDIFRIRRHFARHFPNAAEIIERRPRTRQLRLAIADIEVNKP